FAIQQQSGDSTGRMTNELSFSLEPAMRLLIPAFYRRPTGAKLDSGVCRSYVARIEPAARVAIELKFTFAGKHSQRMIRAETKKVVYRFIRRNVPRDIEPVHSIHDCPAQLASGYEFD